MKNDVAFAASFFIIWIGLRITDSFAMQKSGSSVVSLLSDLSAHRLMCMAHHPQISCYTTFFNLKIRPLESMTTDEFIANVQDIDNPETVGVIVTQDLIDNVMQSYGPKIYNKSLKDALTVVQEESQDIEYTL
jgi:uncharacterized protein (DUF2164 family)